MSHATPVAARSSWLGVCLALLLLGASACGGEDPEPVGAGESTPPSATASPSPSPHPEPWEQRTKAGAVAFVEHWVDVFNEAGATGDTSELRALSAESCATCRQVAELIQGWEEAGTTLKSEGWAVQATQLAEVDEPRTLDIAVRIRRSPETLVKAGGDVEEFPGSEEVYSAQVRWHRGAWRMMTFDQTS